MNDPRGRYLASAPETPPAPPVRSPGRLRFTLGDMLLVTALAAVLVASLSVFPPVVSAAIAGLMSVCIPAMLVGCLIYGRAAWRAFAVGMLVPSGLRLLGGLFGGVLGGMSSARLMTQQQVMQQYIATLSRANRMRGGQRPSSIDYFTNLVEAWDKLGRAYMTEETLFWAGSLVAGLATLLVQQRFARAALTAR
jgi:hypothetical protein